MKTHWNKPRFKRKYHRVLEDAKEHYGFTDEELANPYLDKLSHQTKSPRISRMILLAYILGKLCAIQEIDSGYNEVTTSNTEEEDKE